MLSRALALALALAPAAASAGPFERSQQAAPRYRAAARTWRAPLEAELRAAGAAWPPRIFLRAFKAEDVLELWAAPARGRRWIRVRRFAVCARSGGLGPKRQRGDGQVPEGFYTLDRFNPHSRFHLSLGLDYPHRGDRARTPPGADPGDDIFIHGGCVTVGCLPLQDGPMEALYVLAVLARDGGQRVLPVHVFPCRLDRPDCQTRLAVSGSPARWQHWEALRPGYLAFEATGIPPRIQPEPDGRYRILDP